MPNGSHEYFSLAPVLIHHSGHGMVPYLTWDFSGYTAAATASYQGKPPRHNNTNYTQNRQQHPHPQSQQYNHKNISSNTNRPHRNARKNGYSDSGVHTGNGNMRPSDSTVSLASYNGSESGSLRGGASVATTSLGGASSDMASLRSAPCSPRSERRRRNQHHRKFSTASIESLPAVADGGDDAPDLERFLKASTPCVRLPSGAAAVAELRLSDLWKFFEQSSVFGLECAALGGPRGPSSCYFVPYLSAVHLFRPTGGVEDDDASISSRNSSRTTSSLASNSNSVGENEVFSFPQGLDSWPTEMKRGFSWAAAEHVADRLPLHTRVTELATRNGTVLEDHPLWSSRMVDLHPYSWFAVAWYPLYRIPDAPLTARFLTFHSMAPLWEAATAATRELKETAAAAAAAVGGASAASYKLMLKAGGGGETPTGLMNAYPGSPFASEGTHSGGGSGPNSTSATATTHDPSRSRSHSVASGSDPAFGSDAASLNRSFGSLTHSPATSDAGDDLLRSGGGCALLPGGSSSSIGGDVGRRAGGGGGSSGGTSVGQTISTLSCPAVGLCWHTAGSAAGENWTDTLVAVDVPEDSYGRGLRLGDSLPGSANASVAGVWPRTAVIRKDYPLAKGGPLSWEIQLEELEEGARRLALRQGLVKIQKSGNGGNSNNDAVGVTASVEEEEEAESCCPDYDFFSSRRR
jgi:Protein of unknown function (DUF789)